MARNISYMRLSRDKEDHTDDIRHRDKPSWLESRYSAIWVLATFLFACTCVVQLLTSTIAASNLREGYSMGFRTDLGEQHHRLKMEYWTLTQCYIQQQPHAHPLL